MSDEDWTIHMHYVFTLHYTIKTKQDGIYHYDIEGYRRLFYFLIQFPDSNTIQISVHSNTRCNTLWYLSRDYYSVVLYTRDLKKKILK